MGKSKSKSSAADATPPPEWNDDLQKDFERLLSVGEECVTEAGLKKLLLQQQGTQEVRLYDGFEPSGRMHIAQGVFKAVNVNKCTATPNKKFVFWVADWFALMNDKMGGNLDAIQTTGEYLIQVWKAAGMNLDQVEFQWASQELTEKATTYWPLMLDVARRFNVGRVKRCSQIMGRQEGKLTAAQVLYPLMQCTDVFFLRADICQLGVDQRKVNMLAREYADAAKKKSKPVILSHHMLYGLKQGQEKMSKSDPDSAIFMEDSAADVERKIRAAYCPTKPAATAENDSEEAEGKESMQLVADDLKNPCLDYIQNIIFSPEGATFTAGSTVFDDYEAVKASFLNGSISEDQLKTGLIEALNNLLEPVRQHFTNDAAAKQLLADVEMYKSKAADSAGTPASDRRLDLIAKGVVAAESHLVFAPLPKAKPTMQEALNVLAQLRAGGSQALVLLLQDWCAIVCNAMNADQKAIKAYYAVLLTSLQTLDADLMENVAVVWQSEAILRDPSNYWINVINVGRHYPLNQVMGTEMEESDGVGWVIERLMRVADVVSVNPKSCALNSVLDQELIEGFFRDKLAPALTPPAISQVVCRSFRLQPERESKAQRLDTDEYFLLDDPKVRKLFPILEH